MSSRHRRRTSGVALRLTQMALGTIVMGLGVALLVRAQLGLLPLDVLHAALAECAGWTMGGGIIAVQALLLATCVVLRIRPGVGAVTAVVIPALTCDATLAVLPTVTAMPTRLALLVAGGIACSLGTAACLGAGLGTVPRERLMLELHCRRGYRLSTIRVVLDLACLLAGWLLAGPGTAIRHGIVGAGSVLLALSLRPTIGWLLPRLTRLPYRTGPLPRTPAPRPCTPDHNRR
jgi:uncharacterized membrane protein YczE